MTCPRCGATLVRYTLEGSEAVVCEQCGYVGAPVEHGGEPAEVEPWEEVVSGIDPTDGAAEVESETGVPDVEAAESSAAGVLCPACGERFDSQRGVSVHRGLVHD